VILSADQRLALAGYLLSRFHAVTRTKDHALMVAVALAFNVATLFGVGVPEGAAFRERYWTTLGPVIFAPEGRTDALGAHLRVLCHELTHVVQFWRDPLGLVPRYLSRKGRAELEAEAERAACEVWYLLTGELPNGLASLDFTRHGYAFEDLPGEHGDYADLTRDLLEQACTSVKAGVLSTDVGLEVRSWLCTHAPETIVPQEHRP
jgi:hypothetical protein